MKTVSTIIGTFFYTGLFPGVPATFACFVFALIYALVPGGEFLAHPLVALLTLAVSVPISTSLEKRHGHDARCIVIDEIVGMQLVFVFAQPTALGVVAGFFVFRFFDIVKPFPIGRSQNLPAGWGIVCDDFLAGIFTRVTVIVIAWLIPGIGRFT